MMRKKSSVIYLPRDLTESEAFRKLGGTSFKVLVIFYRKRVMLQVPKLNAKKGKEWICTNDGKITFYYSEAEKKYKISRKTFSRVIDELVSLGFIDIARAGIGYAKVPTLYIISDRWRKFGTQEFEKVERKKRISCNRVNEWRRKKEFSKC